MIGNAALPCGHHAFRCVSMVPAQRRSPPPARAGTEGNKGLAREEQAAQNRALLTTFCFPSHHSPRFASLANLRPFNVSLVRCKARIKTVCMAIPGWSTSMTPRTIALSCLSTRPGKSHTCAVSKPTWRYPTPNLPQPRRHRFAILRASASATRSTSPERKAPPSKGQTRPGNCLALRWTGGAGRKSIMIQRRRLF